MATQNFTPSWGEICCWAFGYKPPGLKDKDAEAMKKELIGIFLYFHHQIAAPLKFMRNRYDLHKILHCSQGINDRTNKNQA